MFAYTIPSLRPALRDEVGGCPSKHTGAGLCVDSAETNTINRQKRHNVDGVGRVVVVVRVGE